MAAMVFSPTASPFRIFSQCRCSTSGITTTGVAYGRTNNEVTFWYQEGDTNLGTQTTGTIKYTLNAWSFSAISVDANGGTTDILHAANRTFDPYPDEPENYGTNNPDTTGAIGADGQADGAFAQNNMRISMFAIWSRALSQTELEALYDRIKLQRYPTLP
jgi:hypothetical protein